MGPVFMVTFRASEYLADRRCQEVLLKLSRTWKGKDPAASALVAEFHPLKDDEMKQARDLEAYVLQFIAGDLNRVHFVKKNGASSRLEGSGMRPFSSVEGNAARNRGALIGQRYKQHLPDVNYEPIGNVAVLGCMRTC
jgi:hypothetical protein